MDQQLLERLKAAGVKRAKYDVSSGTVFYEVEFFEPKPAPMSFDAKSLAETLTDSMPPDSAMLFAATEDPAPTLNHSDGKPDPMIG